MTGRKSRFLDGRRAGGEREKVLSRLKGVGEANVVEKGPLPTGRGLFPQKYDNEGKKRMRRRRRCRGSTLGGFRALC